MLLYYNSDDDDDDDDKAAVGDEVTRSEHNWDRWIRHNQFVSIGKLFDKCGIRLKTSRRRRRRRADVRAQASQASARLLVYTGCSKKTDPLDYFDDNFGKYGQILTMFSLL